MLNLPPGLGIASDTGLHAEVVNVGLSGARVVKLLDRQDAVLAYVKSASASAPHLQAELRGEAERLTWLARRGVRVPEVLGLVSDEKVWLATAPLDGAPASDDVPPSERFSVVTAAATALREFHSIDPRSCPFDRTLRSALADAEERTNAGLVDLSWKLAGKREDKPAVEALRDLREAISTADNGDLVVSHGDYCLPNVLVTNDGGAGFVDVGRAGIADRHSDVADMLRSIRSHLNPQYGEPHAQRFLDVYGREGIEPERLWLHDQLEEFFWPAPL